MKVGWVDDLDIDSVGVNIGGMILDCRRRGRGDDFRGKPSDGLLHLADLLRLFLQQIVHRTGGWWFERAVGFVLVLTLRR